MNKAKLWTLIVYSLSKGYDESEISYRNTDPKLCSILRKARNKPLAMKNNGIAIGRSIQVEIVVNLPSPTIYNYMETRLAWDQCCKTRYTNNSARVAEAS